MPRTVESIVHNYQEAERRRRSGRPVWDFHLKLEQPAPQGIVFHTIPPQTLKQSAERYAAALVSTLPAGWFDVCSDDYNDDMATVLDSLKAFDPDHTPSHCSSCYDEMTEIIDLLYDCADELRVWIDFVYPKPESAPSP